MDKTMTPLMPNPFLSASDGLHPLSSVAVAPLAPPALGATAEISSAEPLSAGPAVVADLSPGSVTTAGTNSSLGVVASSGTDQRLEIDPRNAGYFPGPAASGAVWHGKNGCSDAPPCDLTRPSQFNPSDCINEIFTFARGLMRDYQPDFQELLNEIAPFPMEYLSDYRLGDDDQPLFLQGAVA